LLFFCSDNEYINFVSDIYGIDSETRKERFDYYLGFFDLRDAMDNQIASYFHGMAQRLALIGVLINDPPVIFLDEPMVGLDAKSAYNLKQILRERAASGKIVFFPISKYSRLIAFNNRNIYTGWQNPKELMQGGMRFFTYYIISFVVIIDLTSIFYAMALKRYKKGVMDV